MRNTRSFALKQYECSFCGQLEDVGVVKMKPVHSLDISFLRKAVQLLRDVCRQPKIQCFRPESILHNTYFLCHLCALSVVNDSFRSIPVRSYANGLWIGDVPDELRGLTFLEEQCIARARAAKCMYKLSIGPSGQMAAHGNVYILPQNSHSFVAAMPVPLFRIRDEICVILVGSPDSEVTFHRYWHDFNI